MPDEVSVDVYVPHRAPLSGSELKEFLAEEEEERRAKKEEAERKAMMREIELARGRLRLGGDEEGGTTGGFDDVAAHTRPYAGVDVDVSEIPRAATDSACRRPDV